MCYFFILKMIKNTNTCVLSYLAKSVETLPFLHVCVYVFSAQLHFAGSYFPSKQLPRNAQSKKRSYQKCKTSVMGCFAWIIFLRVLEIIFSSSDSESAGKIRSRNCSICSFILAPGHRPNTSLCSISVPLTSKPLFFL